jgi:hypothetical protein
MNTSTLERIRADFARRGWDESFLDVFRMEMSGQAAAAAQQGSGQNGGQQSAQSQGGDDSGQGSAEGQQSEYSLAEGFLGRVPQEHRAIMEPYVRQWDAGVTRRFAELHSQLAPYEELGDMESLQAASNLARMLEENPYQVYGILHQALINGEMMDPQTGQAIAPGSPFPQQQGQQQMLPGQQEQGLGNEEIPAPVAQRLDAITQAVVALGQHFLGQQQMTQEQQEDAQLEEFLTTLHTEYGDFDEHWVIGRMLNGSEPDQAIQEFNDLVNSRATAQISRNSGLPSLLGSGTGGSGVPADPSNVKNLNRKQTQDLVKSVLASAASQRNGQ